MPKEVRDRHFFASLDFVDGGAIYQRVSECFRREIKQETKGLIVAWTANCSYNAIPPGIGGT